MLCDTVPEELGLMVARGLAPMVAAGFLKDLTNEVIVDTENHTRGVDRLRVVVNNDRNPRLESVAFAASNVRDVSIYKRDDERALHLGGIIVSPGYQGKRIGKMLIEDEMVQVSASLLAFHTQNRHMLELGEVVTRYSYTLSSALAEEFETKDPQTKIIGNEMRVIEEARYGKTSLYGHLRRDIAIRGLGRGGNAIFYVGERK